MTIEHSHGKARPTLPRASDLTAPTDEQRRRNHATGGRFAHGNSAACGKGWKAAYRAQLRADIGAEIPNRETAAMVLADGWRVFSANLRELPADGSIVRGLLLRKVRHETLAAYWDRQVLALGLGSPASQAAEDRAGYHGQRLERLTVTLLDVARVVAARPAKTDAVPVGFTEEP